MIHPCIDNKYILYIAKTWMPQEENNVELRESFILRQTYFSVNDDMQQH
jgi:hypothetical protein